MATDAGKEVESLAERAATSVGMRIASHRVFRLDALPDPIAEQLRYFDKNGDGNIDVFELVEMVERFRAQEEAAAAIADSGGTAAVSLKAFPGAVRDVLARVYPHSPSSGAIAVDASTSPHGAGIHSAIEHKRDELEAMVIDLKKRMARLVRVMAVLLVASFVFTLGALFGLMIGADELIFKPEFKAAPDGTLFSIHSSLPARVICASAVS